MMPGLTPTWEVPFVRQLGRGPHHHPGCVPQRVAVRGIMDIRVDNKAVAPARQPLVGVMAAKAVAVPHHQFVDVACPRPVARHPAAPCRRNTPPGHTRRARATDAAPGACWRAPEAGRSRSQVPASARQARKSSTRTPRTDRTPIAVTPDPLLQEPEYRFPQFDIQVHVPQAAQELDRASARIGFQHAGMVRGWRSEYWER